MVEPTAQSPEPAKDGEEGKEIAAPKEYTKSTHFLFDHKLFAIPDCCFTKDPNTGDPGLSLPLGEIRAFLPLGPLMKMFKDFTEDDTRLLNVAIRGLSHVKEIRPGDSIPAEILDGSASWSVGPEQLDRARGRIFVALASVDGKPIDWTIAERGATGLQSDPAFEERKTKALAMPSASRISPSGCHASFRISKDSAKDTRL
ncbi:hypothetical protein [Sphingomonas daechungensis]|uniref:hypothetical protein n=1 Tax=Sphingomonas daechungensis TaxID=1176646 RepID=UPI003783BEDF